MRGISGKNWPFSDSTSCELHPLQLPWASWSWRPWPGSSPATPSQQLLSENWGYNRISCPTLWVFFSLFISPLLSNFKNILKAPGNWLFVQTWVSQCSLWTKMEPRQPDGTRMKTAAVVPASTATGNSCLQVHCLTPKPPVPLHGCPSST